MRARRGRPLDARAAAPATAASPTPRGRTARCSGALLQAYVALVRSRSTAASTTPSWTRRTPSARASSSRCSRMRWRRPTSSRATRRRCASSSTPRARASIRGLANFVEDLSERHVAAAAGRRAARSRSARTSRRRRARWFSATRSLELIQYAPTTARGARAAAPHRAAADQQVLRVRPRAGEQPRPLVARERRADVRRQLAQPDARRTRTGASTPTSRRSSRRSMRCARSPGRPTSTSSARARAASRCRRCSAISPPRRERKVHSATLAVCVLDMPTMRDTTSGLFTTPATIAAAKAASRKRGVLEGAELARVFAWMRPNDLVWNYVVNNYLLGNEPPAYDILFWNSDTTRLPARLHADFLDLIASQPVSALAQAARPRPHDRPSRRRDRHLRRRRPHRPHHAVAGRLPDGAALRRPRSTFVLCERRSRPEPDQPAGQQAVVVRRGAGARGDGRRLARTQAEERRIVVAALARLAAGARGQARRCADGARQRATPAARPAPGTYVLER